MAETPNRFQKFYPGVEIREIGGRHATGYFNITQLAAALGLSVAATYISIRKGLFTPDFISKTGPFFDEKRLEEFKEKWAARKTLFPGYVPAKGVITQFGMMIPRARPDAKLLERLARTRPKRPSRDSSWKTRKRYNLSDLTP